jgi:peroxiredoxin
VEFPHLQALYEKYAGDHFAILSVETTNRPELAKEFVEQFGATFPVLLDEQKTMRETFELAGVPATLMIDAKGNVIFRHLGFSPGHEKMLEAEVKVLLEEEFAVL